MTEIGQIDEVDDYTTSFTERKQKQLQSNTLYFLSILTLTTSKLHVS